MALLSQDEQVARDERGMAVATRAGIRELDGETRLLRLRHFSGARRTSSAQFAQHRISDPAERESQ